jgi:DNA modification methylase
VWKIGPGGSGTILAGKGGVLVSDGGASSIFITSQPPKTKTPVHVRVGPGETIGVTTPGTSTAWEVSPDPREEYLHPTQKPAELARIAIQNSSAAGDIVLDCFGGAGATAVACEQLGRICHIMDLEPKYVAVILERLALMGLSPQLAAENPASANVARKSGRVASERGAAAQ